LDKYFGMKNGFVFGYCNIIGQAEEINAVKECKNY
jgi:hypothetical protein